MYIFFFGNGVFGSILDCWRDEKRKTNVGMIMKNVVVKNLPNFQD